MIDDDDDDNQTNLTLLVLHTIEGEGTESKLENRRINRIRRFIHHPQIWIETPLPCETRTDNLKI